MARHDPVERPAQGCPIEGAEQPEAARDVIGLAGSFELREEPEPLLSEGEFEPAVTIYLCDRWQFSPRGALDRLREIGQDRILEKIGHRDVDPQFLRQS